MITHWGFPCCARFPCVHAAATTPVQQLGVFLAHLTQLYQPSPIPLSGRPAHRPFRGLLGVHPRCGLHTRAVTVYRDRYPGASDISSPPCLPRLLPAGAVAGWALHPLEKRRLVTAHVVSRPSRIPRRTPIPAIRGIEIESHRVDPLRTFGRRMKSRLPHDAASSFQ